MLKTAIGPGCGNAPIEVKIVQALLNQWLADNRQSVLKVDGLVGPLTGAAIKSFQAGNNTGRDGRVDPNGPTLHALANYQLAHFAAGMRNTYDGAKLLSILPRRSESDERATLIAALRTGLTNF